VDFWVALTDPVGRVQHESAFHKSGLVRAGNKSRSPLLEFPVLRDRRRVDRLRPNPEKKQALNRPDEQAIAAIEQLIKEMCNRLDRLGGRESTRCSF
jgi:hypothetical protein